jgi:hypothetical protein
MVAKMSATDLPDLGQCAFLLEPACEGAPCGVRGCAYVAPWEIIDFSNRARLEGDELTAIREVYDEARKRT